MIKMIINMQILLTSKMFQIVSFEPNHDQMIMNQEHMSLQ